VRRSRRRGHNRSYRRDYSSSTGSETEVYRLRRRKNEETNIVHVIYRIGDKVEIKNHDHRSMRVRWDPAEVCKVYRDGMYGELTYSVWLKDTRMIEDFIHPDELRFRNPRDLDRRLKEDEIVRDDEIVRCQEEIRLLNLEQARQQQLRGPSMRGRRPQRAARAWKQPRAQSLNGDPPMPARANRPETRAMSVPPSDINWPEFFAKIAKIACRGGDQLVTEKTDDNEIKEQNPPFETGMYDRQSDLRRHDDDYIDGNELGNWRGKGDLDHRDIVADVDRGGDNVADYIEFGNAERIYPTHQNTYTSDRQVNYEMNLKDRGGIKVNVVLPPGTGIQHGGNM